MSGDDVFVTVVVGEAEASEDDFCGVDLVVVEGESPDGDVASPGDKLVAVALVVVVVELSDAGEEPNVVGGDTSTTARIGCTTSEGG